MPPAHPVRNSPFRGYDHHRVRKRRIRGNPAPVHIQEYRLNLAKWPQRRRGGRKRGRDGAPRLNIRDAADLTVDAILGWNKDEYTCLVCGEFCEECEGEACYTGWRRGPARRLRKCVEVRDTGTPGMGSGAYVKPGRRVEKGKYLGEYLGELVPPEHGGGEDLYTFDIPDLCRVDASRYGNLTRFFNHGCQPNVEAEVELVGGRRVVVFRALRDIEAGEQVLVDYGPEYFGDHELECACGAQNCMSDL